MKHPSTRAARRHVRDTYQTYRRSIMKNWGAYSRRKDWNWITSNHWWASCGKNNGAHGCRMCKYEKYDRGHRRKRRKALQDPTTWEFSRYRRPY